MNQLNITSGIIIRINSGLKLIILSVIFSISDKNRITAYTIIAIIIIEIVFFRTFNETFLN
tara:strand:+ start:4305 stop:4487 length:183 start_codon:yes stop_codon:yes gene_type:complete